MGTQITKIKYEFDRWNKLRITKDTAMLLHLKMSE